MVKDISTYIRYSDLYGKIVSFEQLVSTLKSFNFTECINYLSKLQILLSKHQFNQDFQFEMINRIFTEDIISLILREKERRISNGGPRLVMVFHERQVYNLLMLVLVNCNNRVRRSMDNPTVMKEFSECLLIMNDHLEPVSKVANIDKLPQDRKKEIFAELSIRGLSFTSTDNLSHLLVRYYELFHDVPEILRENDPVDIPKVFKGATGLSLLDYFALGFSLLTHYQLLNIENINHNPIHIDPKIYFKNTPIKKNQINRILKDLCSNRKELKKRYHEELSQTRMREYSFLTIKNKPLVRINNSIFSISHKYLGDKITEGIYHTVLNALESKKKKEEFLAYFGIIFENYVKSILNRIYPESPPLKRFFSDIYYGRDKKEAGDGIIVYEDSIVIIEAKSSRLLASTIVSGDIREYKDKLDKSIIKGARTINRVIKDFQKGKFTIDGLPVETVRRFYPLILTIQYFPQNPLLWEIIEKKLISENCLQDKNIARLQIMEVGILEKLEPFIASGVSFLEILRNKDADDTLRNYSFSHLIDTDPRFEEIDKNEYMRKKYHEISEEIKSMVFGKRIQ